MAMQWSSYRARVVTILLTSFWLRGIAFAQAGTEPSQALATGSEAPADPNAQAAPEPQAPSLPWQPGPRTLDLGNQIELALPEGYAYLAQPHASQLMEKMGNLHNEGLLGLVIGGGEDSDWFVTLRYEEEGYVKDDESVDADELLDSMRESLVEFNEERKQRGFAALKLDGWDEAPHYDKQAHHLVWCLRVSDEDGASANYNTRILGRKGYVSVNLVTDPSRVSTDKPHAAALLAATRFQPGARYEDFNDSTDKVAEYGLAGLVAGGVGLGAMKLVKLGLLAKSWKVLLAILIAGKKAIVPLFVALGMGVKKLFGRKSAVASPEQPPQA